MAVILLDFTGSRVHSRPPIGRDKTTANLSKTMFCQVSKSPMQNSTGLVATYMSQSFF